MNVIDIRSSSVGLFMDCSEMWAAIYIEKRPSPGSVPAWMGTSIHAGSARYDLARLQGNKPQLEEAVQTALHTFDHPVEDLRWTDKDYTRAKARAITILATEKYCNELSPRFEFGGVELRPEPLEIVVDGLVMRLTGQMDRTRLIKDGKGQGISDLKTGKRIITNSEANTNGHKFQIGVYELLLEQHTQKPVTMPGVIAAVSTTERPQAAIGYVHGAKDLLLGTDGRPGVLERMAGIIKRGDFLPNPRSMLCSERYCPIHHKCKAVDRA
jgi:hypothetical protein